jgi:hypothetical protein
MIMVLSVLIAHVLLAPAWAAGSADSDVPLTAPGGPPGLLAVAPIAPLNPMVIEGKAYLVYELILTNFQTAPVVLDSIRADGGMGTAFNFDDPAALKSMIDLPARYAEAGKELTIAPLSNRIMLLWLEFGSLRQLPHRIVHRIGYSIASGDQPSVGVRKMSINTDALEVDYQRAPVIIGPPLRGNDWLAGNAPSNTSGHRRACFVANGKVYFPERFAIDFVQLGADGKTYSGDAKNNHSYHAYNADILAVADGKVADVVGGIPDNVPGSTALPITLATIGGNYVIEDIGHGAYAFYAHLIPGSIKVSVGATVKRGQVLGHLGNSGNSTEPHLHFHVISRPSPLGGNGLPYAFDHFTLMRGHANESSAEISYVFEGGAARPVSDSLVLENAVINFP